MKLRLASLMNHRILAPIGGGLIALMCAEPLPAQAPALDRIEAVAVSVSAAQIVTGEEHIPATREP